MVEEPIAAAPPPKEARVAPAVRVLQVAALVALLSLLFCPAAARVLT